ncbi:MAG: 50S ribosomal protein L17 [Parcubacteria group bacterium]|nr:50S ribosomal protein L17 [Parcubacteria group bacterium]
MRHHKKGRTFGRVKKRQVALLRSLARSLVLQGSITTTVAKAKEVRPFVERLVTLAKSDTLASRRTLASRMGNAADVVAKLHTDIAKKYAARAGGYTRITKLGKQGARRAEEAKIEFV